MAAPVDAAAVQALPGVSCVDKCIPDGMKLSIAICLVATLAGLSTDPASLLAGASCIDKCIPPGMRMAIVVDLGRQLAGQ